MRSNEDDNIKASFQHYEDKIAALQARLRSWRILSSQAPVTARYIFAVYGQYDNKGSLITALEVTGIMIAVIGVLRSIVSWNLAIQLLVSLVVAMVSSGAIRARGETSIVPDKVLGRIADSSEIPAEHKKEIARWVSQYEGKLKWHSVLVFEDRVKEELTKVQHELSWRRRQRPPKIGAGAKKMIDIAKNGR